MQGKNLFLSLLQNKSNNRMFRNCTYNIKVSKRMQKQATERLRAGVIAGVNK